MRRARLLTLMSALAPWAGCDSAAGPIAIDGTVASLSPGSTAPLLASLFWLYDDGMEDTAAAATTFPIQGSLPMTFGFSVEEPAHFYADFDYLRELPRCSTEPTTL